MPEQLNFYLVVNKDDDYGNARKELVETTLKNAKEYYSYKEVSKEDIETLKKYFTFVCYEVEKERDEDRRFYGSD